MGFQKNQTPSKENPAGSFVTGKAGKKIEGDHQIEESISPQNGGTKITITNCQSWGGWEEPDQKKKK